MKNARTQNYTLEYMAKEFVRNSALLERVIHQNDILIETIGEMRDLVNLIPTIKKRLDAHDDQFEIIISAIKDISRQSDRHERELLLLMKS